jgi:hypothetical protein
VKLRALAISLVALTSCRYGWCLAPFFGPEAKPDLVTPLDGGYHDENWWPDSGSSTVEDITDAGAAQPDVIEPARAARIRDQGPDSGEQAYPCLDSFPPCADYAFALHAVGDREHAYGVYMPVRPGTDLSAYPGSHLLDGGCIAGMQHVPSGAVRFEADCSSMVVSCRSCSSR